MAIKLCSILGIAAAQAGKLGNFMKKICQIKEIYLMNGRFHSMINGKEVRKDAK